MCAFFLVLSTVQALACANGPGADDGGTRLNSSTQVPTEPIGLRSVLHPEQFDKAKYEAQLARYAPSMKPNSAGRIKASVDDQIIYGLALIFTGKHAEARDWFARLENEYPGQYGIAANLGTCYELTGDNANALKWINEGMKRNPQSHWGTEWLHSKILEAKLNIEKDPDWLKNHTVLGINFGGDPEPQVLGGIPLVDNTGQMLDINGVVRGLIYQLGERTKFIRTPEPVVADLMEDLGNALLVTNSPEAASVAYQRAKDYGAHSPRLDERMAYAASPRTIQKAAIAAEVRESNPVPAVVGGIATVLLGCFGFLFLRRRQLSA
jgi:tetratricopeptide (TPR) repeat protein